LIFATEIALEFEMKERELEKENLKKVKVLVNNYLEYEV